MSAEVKLSKTARKILRADITRTENKVCANDFNPQFENLEVLLARSLELHENIKAADKIVFQGLLSSGTAEADLQTEYDATIEYTNKILNCITKLRALSNPPPQPQLHGTVAGNPSKLKLPQVSLPTYSHKDSENLHKFFTNLENILDKYNLSDYEKFVYLQGQLSGEPLSLVKSLDGAEQSYAAAKDLLTRAFASVITQQFDNIKRMAELKFAPKLPYEFLGTFRQIREAFKNLNVSTDIILQYFFGIVCRSTYKTNS